MQFTNILWTLIAGAWYGTSSPAPDGNCSSASDNIALIQRQASVQAHAADPSPELTSVKGATATIHGIWGDWGGRADCPAGEPIIGVWQKTEADQGGNDDTSLNGVMFYCRGGVQISSLEGRYGDYGPSAQCPGITYMIGFKLKVEKNQGGNDDTAANAIEILCSDHTYMAPAGGGRYGDWHFTSCPAGQWATGFRSRVEADQGGNDDTSLNGIEVFCASTPAPTPYPTTPTPTASPTPYPTTPTPTTSPTSSPTASPTQVSNQCANI